MTEGEYSKLIEDLINEDTRDLAKVGLLEYFNNSSTQIKEYKNSVNVLRDQNSKLAMRITGTADTQEQENPEEVFEREMDTKIKDFVDNI